MAEEIECDLTLCNIGPKIELSCRSIAETIDKVVLSTIVDLSGNFTLGDSCLVNSNLGQCGSVSKLIEERCVGEFECSVDVAAAMQECGLAPTQTVFVNVECSEGEDLMTYLLWLLLVMIGLGLGASIDLYQVKEVWQKKKVAFLVGLLGQIVFMPLVGLILVQILNFSALMAVGVIVTSTAPGGTSSNLFSYYIGDVALSLAMSGVSTLCSLFTIPMFIYLYGTLALGLEKSIDIPFGSIIFTVALMVVPAFLGIVLRRYAGKDREHDDYFKWKDPAFIVEFIGVTLGIFFLIAVFVTGIESNEDLLDPAKYSNLWIGAAIFQPIGATIGYLLAFLSSKTHLGKNINGPECRTISFEVGIQNFTLALAIVAGSFEGCQRAQVIAFPLAAGFWWFINSVWMFFVFYYLQKRETSRIENSKSTDLEPRA